VNTAKDIKAASVLIRHALHEPSRPMTLGDFKPTPEMLRLVDEDIARIICEELMEELSYPPNEWKVRQLFGFWFRQGFGGTFPKKVPMTPALAALTDEATAQKIWSELLATRSCGK
jgi:hypothetical protein